MDRIERFYRIDQLLQQRPAVPMATLLDKLEVSQATVKRDLEYLRDRLNAPIVWDPELRGYCYRQDDQTGPRYALPGLWFNESEIHALLTMDRLLGEMQPGLLRDRIAPLRQRIRELLASGDHSADTIARRIVVRHLAARPVDSGLFQTITTALLARRRLTITHLNRRRGETVSREVSPQRLVHYRENWYLDTWCHLRNGLRRFSIDAMAEVNTSQRQAKNIAVAVLEREFGDSYGIFTGPATDRALLRFTAERARWVTGEQWHPHQVGETDEQGYYLLTVPYSDPTELVMDILRYGPDVEVLEPPSLRRAVQERLARANSVYAQDREAGKDQPRSQRARRDDQGVVLFGRLVP